MSYSTADPPRKRMIQEVQNEIDKEAAEGNINEGAYLRLGKKVKAAYEYSEVDQHGAGVYCYLIKQLLEHPESAAVIPKEFRSYVESPKFVKALIAMRIRCVEETGDAGQDWRTDWLQNFFKGMFPQDTMLDEESPKEFDREWFQKVIVCLLEARRDLVEPLMDHMDEIEVYPSHAGGEIGHGYTTTETLPLAVKHEPRFLWWLLNPGTVDDFTYEPWEVEMMQQHAYEHRANTLDQRNRKFLGALGLRGIGDLKECEALTEKQDKTFADAKAIVLAKPYVWNTVPDDTPPDPVPMPRPPQNNQYTWEI